MTKSTERVLASRPFVDAMARRVAVTLPPCVDRADLVQDGLLALWRVSRRFDATRGVAFETFAHDRIHGAMVDGLRRGAGSRIVRERRRQLDTVRRSLRQVLQAEPTTEDLAVHLGMAIDTVWRTLAPPPTTVPDTPPQPDTLYAQAEARRRVHRAIAALPSRQRQIVRAYYFRDVPQARLSAALGVTPGRISQLHTRALQTLRRVLYDAH